MSGTELKESSSKLLSLQAQKGIDNVLSSKGNLNHEYPFMSSSIEYKYDSLDII